MKHLWQSFHRVRTRLPFQAILRAKPAAPVRRPITVPASLPKPPAPEEPRRWA